MLSFLIVITRLRNMDLAFVLQLINGGMMTFDTKMEKKPLNLLEQGLLPWSRPRLALLKYF